MIIHDKALLRCLQAAYTGEGYRVAAGRDEESGESILILCTNSWAVRMERRICPKTVLAKIVLHAGAIPMMGEAMLVRKKEVQTMIWTEATNTLQVAESMAEMAENPPTMKWTGFTWKGLEMWQGPKTKTIWLMDPAFTDMAVMAVGGNAACVGHMMHWHGIASDLYVCPCSADSSLSRQAVKTLEEQLWLEE